MNWRTSAAFVAISLLWGSAWILTSFPIPQPPTLLAGAIRFAVAALFTGLLALIARLRKTSPQRKKLSPTVAPSLILGVTMVGLPFALTVWAAGDVSSAVVAILFALMPLFALFMSSEDASASIPALVLGAGGVAFLVSRGLSTSLTQITGGVLLLIAVAAEAFSLNYARSRLRHLDVLASVSIQFFTAAILLGVLSAATEHGQFGGWNRMDWDGQSIAALLVLACAVSGITLPLLYWLLARLETWQVASLQWAATLIAVVEAALFLHAKPTLEMGAGVAMIVGAILWLLRSSTGGRSPTVTLQITSHTFPPADASESKLR
jgi:drug/metabolite transporter (DMT)-like permease